MAEDASGNVNESVDKARAAKEKIREQTAQEEAKKTAEESNEQLEGINEGVSKLADRLPERLIQGFSNSFEKITNKGFFSDVKKLFGKSIELNAEFVQASKDFFSGGILGRLINSNPLLSFGFDILGDIKKTFMDGLSFIGKSLKIFTVPLKLAMSAIKGILSDKKEEPPTVPEKDEQQEEVIQNQKDSNSILEEINEVMHELLSVWDKERLEALEAKREASRKQPLPKKEETTAPQEEKKAEGLLGKMRTIFAGITAFFVAKGGFLAGTLEMGSKIFNRLLLPVTALIGFVEGFISGTDSLVIQADSVFGNILQRIAFGIVGASKKVIGILSNVVIDGMTYLQGMILSALGFEKVGAFLMETDFSKMLTDKISEGWTNIIAFVSDIFSTEGRERIGGFIGEIFSPITNFLMEISKWIEEKIKTVTDFIPDFSFGFFDKEPEPIARSNRDRLGRRRNREKQLRVNADNLKTAKTELDSETRAADVRSQQAINATSLVQTNNQTNNTSNTTVNNVPARNSESSFATSAT